MPKVRAEYGNGFGKFDVEGTEEEIEASLADLDAEYDTYMAQPKIKAKRNLDELMAAPEDRERGLFAGKAPDAYPETFSGATGAAAADAYQRSQASLIGNLAAVPSAMDRAVGDAGEFIVGGGLTGAPQPLDPFDGQPIKKGVPLYAGKRILDTPQTNGGPAMLSGVANDIRRAVPEMDAQYADALAKKNLGQKLMDPTWYQNTIAGTAPQMGLSLIGGALGGRAGSAIASSTVASGREFQRTQDYEEETGRRADNAGLKALLSGGLQGALDSIVPGSIATGGVKANAKGALKSFLTEGGTEDLQLLISDAISPAEQRSFGERMTDPKYLMDLAEEGVAGGIMGGAMHPLGQSGLRPTLKNAPTLAENLKPRTPADIIEGRDGTQGMQPVDMKVPEKGVSAAVAPNPDRSARVVPADTPVPPGMAAMTVEGGLLLYDKSAANPADVRRQTFTPEGLAAFLAANGTPAASGQPSTTNAAQAAPPPLLVPPVAQTDAEVAELAKQIAARPAPPKALEPEEVAKKIERLVADPRTTPEEREILVAKYEQLTKVVQQRSQDAEIAKGVGPRGLMLDGSPEPTPGAVVPSSPIPLFGTKGKGLLAPNRDLGYSDAYEDAPLEEPPLDAQLAELLRQSAEEDAAYERSALERKRGRAVLDALPEPMRGDAPSTRLDLLYDLRVNGRSLSPDERAALDAEIAAEEAKLAPPPEPTPEPGPFAPVPPELKENLRLASPEGVARVRDEATAREIAKTAPSGRLAMLTDLWHTGTTLSPEERQRLWDKIVLAAGGPVAAREAIQPRFPQGDAPSRLDRVLSETTPALNAPLNQIVDAAQPPPKEEGLAARKARERAEAAKAVAPITISKPPPGPKKPPAAPAAPKAEPQQKSFAVRQQEKRGETPKSEPKAEAKPEPKPVAKEAPVAQPVQQPKAVAPEPKKTLGSETNEQYKARILAAKEAKAAADAAKTKPAPAPMPDKKQARLAELAEAEAAVAEAEQALAAAPEKKKWQFESQLKAARAEVLEVRRKASGDGVTEAEMGPYKDPFTAAKVEAPDVTPQVTIETSPFMQARRAAEAEAAKEAKPEPKKKADAPKTLRYEDGLRRFFRGTKLQSPIDAEGKLQWLSEHGQPSTDTGRRLRYEYHMSDGRVLSAEGAFRETNPKEYERLMAQYGDLRSAKARLGVYKGLPKDTREAMVRDVPWREIAETVKKFGSEASAITHWMKQNGHLLDDAWSRDEALSGRFVGIVNDITRADKHSSPSGREAAQAYNARNRGATDGVSGERPFVMYRRGDQWFKLPSRSEGLELAGWELKMEVEKAPKAATPAKADTPKTVEVNKLAAAVAKEKALRAKRDADPENEALLDEYNDATAELYALTKEANGKGVSTLEVTKDDDTPSLMKTIPQREARVDAFGKNEPMSREAFSKALEAAKAKLPGIADLVDALDSQADLPSDVAAVANGDRIDGFTQNGRVVVVADGMTSAEHVAATLAHEAVGHLVPESVFGRNEWRKRLDEMMASSTWFRDFVANFGKSEVGSRYKAAELASEAIAFEANRVLDDANYKPPNAYRMFIAKLREWLREAIGARRVIGLSKVLEFSDRDLAAFLARSKRTAETGLPKNRRKGDAKPSFAKASAAPPTGTDFEAPDEAGFDTFRRKIQDRMIRLRRLEEAAKKQGRTGTASMYDAEDAAHGRIGTEIEDLRSQFVDPIVRLAAKGNITDQEIGDWLYSVHALDRNARGRKLDPAGQISPDPFSGMTDKEAMDNLTRLAPKSNELSDIAEIVYAMLADERRRYVQSGLANQDEVDSWVKSMGPVYVPLKHEEADGVRGAGVGQGFSALRRTVQSAKGRSDLAENPLFHAIKQAETTVVRANKAEVGREFLKFIRENPNKDLWVEDPKIRKKALADDGSGGTKLEWTPDPLFMRDDIINVKENGENITVQIKDPLTLRAMKMAFAGETTGEVVRGMAMATRTFGSLLTMLNPEFWGTNPIRDVQTAALNVGTAYGLKHAAKVGKVWGKSMRGVAKFIRDPQSQDEYAKLFAEMRKEGATVGWAPFEDAKSIERRIQADMKVLQRGPKDPRTWANTALRYTKNVNEVMENATRLAVYKMATDAGITGRERRALTKNVTVNFNRKGEYGPAFNAFYMFGNVGIQGPVAMASFAKKNPKGFVKVAGAMFALGAANAAVNMMLSDDDDDDGLTAYAELQESTKARNWILGRGMIPMPHGWNVFANAGRYAVEVMSGGKKPVEAAAALAGNAMDSFSPLGQSPTLGQAISPTFSDPIVQHEGNRTAFDSPIRPENLPFGAKKPDSQLKFKSAPEWAVKTAEGLNTLTGGDRVTPGGIDVSPETLQHGVDWATPGLFKFLWSTLVTLPTNLISGKETRVKDIPIVRRFVNAEPPSADRGRFVKAAEDLDTKYSQAKAYSGGKGEADKDLEKYNSLLSGPLRSRTDFEKMRKLYGQLDDVPSTPEIEDLKLRVVRVAGKQYELAKRTDRYVPLDEGLIDDLTERVDVAAPKAEKAEENPGDMVKEALEGR